jgi:hypothetical protein
MVQAVFRTNHPQAGNTQAIKNTVKSPVRGLAPNDDAA